MVLATQLFRDTNTVFIGSVNQYGIQAPLSHDIKFTDPIYTVLGMYTISPPWMSLPDIIISV